MSKFKKGEIVLVPNGDGTFSPKRINAIGIDGEHVSIYCGHYAVDYKQKSIHKCPESIIKMLKAREE